MHALTGKNLKFYTAPIVGYATIDGQAANQIDIPTIQAVIKEKFTAPAPTPAGKAAPSRSRPRRPPRSRPRRRVTVDVYNGGQHAAGLATGLAGAGREGLQGRRGHQRRPRSRRPSTAGTQVFYGAGASANAAKIAGVLRRDRHRADLAARRARRGAPRHRVHRGARLASTPDRELFEPPRRPRPTSTAGTTARRAVPSPSRRTRSTEYPAFTKYQSWRLPTVAAACSNRQEEEAMFTAHVVRVIAGKVGYTVSCLLRVGAAGGGRVRPQGGRRPDRQVGNGVTDQRQPLRRRDEHPGDGPGEPDQLPGAMPNSDHHLRCTRCIVRHQRSAPRTPTR